MADTSVGKPGKWACAGEWVLKILALFVIFEPIWMLLPFAGFLYGFGFLSVESLGQRPSTAWLTHFVFPVGTLGWTGPVMVLAGIVVFSIGAGQIYWAKFRKSGLVTTGLYRYVRNPQYIALTLVGLGLLLAWGRATMFIAFFAMMFLYYYLARQEERVCLRLFGDAFERYRERTSFIFPGDRHLRPLAARLPHPGLPAPLRVGGAFLATMGVCFGLMWLINIVKSRMGAVPFLRATVQFDGGAENAAPDHAPAAAAREAGGVSFAQAGRTAVVRGPTPNAAAGGFAERVLARLPQSKKLQGFLRFLEQPEGDAAIVFCAPFVQPEGGPGTPGSKVGARDPDRRGPAPDPSGPDRVRLIIMRCALEPGAEAGNALADKAKRQIRGACIAPVNLARAEGEDIVEGDMVTPGPGFPGEQRWDFLMGQMAARRTAVSGSGTASMGPSGAASATLVMVQAPIMRTRRDPAFAQEILDRLTASTRVREQMRGSGAGGPVVAVAFPRPGPNWYSEHHGTPQISVFVMLARLRSPDAPLEELFKRDGRELLGAFIADMDLGADPTSSDPVHELAVVGPRRDLEERWEFFLSGVSGAGAR